MATKSKKESKVLKDTKSASFKTEKKSTATKKKPENKAKKTEESVKKDENLANKKVEEVTEASTVVPSTETPAENKTEEKPLDNNETKTETPADINSSSEEKPEENSSDENKDPNEEEQPKENKKSLAIGIIIAALVLAGVGTGVGVYFATKKGKVIDQSKDLIEDNEYTQTIIDNVDISNHKVELGKDFETTLTIKNKNNYRLNDVTVYTLRETNAVTNAETKVQLYKDRDYTFSVDDNNEKGNLKVFSSSFNNKIILNITLKIMSFDDLIDNNEENYKFFYDGKAHDVRVTIKEGRHLPDYLKEDTKITYVYEKDGTSYPVEATFNNHKCHSFTEIGEYPVKVKLHSQYVQNDYESTINSKIIMEELSQDEQNQLHFNNLNIRKNTDDEVTFTELQAKEGRDYSYKDNQKPRVQYQIDGKWTTEKPVIEGDYPVQVIYKFKYFKDFTINNTCHVIHFADISVNFSVNSDLGGHGCWNKDESDTKDRCSEKKTEVVYPLGTKFKNFKDASLGSDVPTKDGYTFKGWFRQGDNERKLIDDDEYILDEANFTVCALFAVNSYKLNVEYDELGASISEYPTTVEYNNKVQIKITVKEKYKLKGVYVNYIETKVIPMENYYLLEFNMPSTDTVVHIITVGTEMQINYIYDEERVTVSEETKTIVSGEPVKFKYTNNDGFEVYYLIMHTDREDGSAGREIYLDLKPGELYQIDLLSGEWSATFTFVSIANFQTLKFDANGGEKSTAPDSISVPYTYKIKEVLDSQEPKLVATDEYAAFRGWMENKEGDTLIGDDVTMPNTEKTLYASWYKYKFEFIKGEGVTEVTGGIFENRTHLTKADLDTVIFKTSEGYEKPKQFKVYVGDEEKERMTTDLYEVLAPGKFADPVLKDNVTIKLEPVCDTTLYNIRFVKYGGNSVYIYNDYRLTELRFGRKVLERIEDNNIYATNDDSGFYAWYDTDGNKIDQDYIMPNHDITIVPTWNTYEFKIVDNGQGNEGFTYRDESIFDKYKISLDEFDLKIKPGYVYDYTEIKTPHIQFWVPVNRGLLITPYLYDPQMKYNDVCEIRVFCKKTVDIILYANGGYFDGGANFKSMAVPVGSTWGEVYKTMPKPYASMKIFLGWVDEEGNDIDNSKVFDTTCVLFAKWNK